MLDMMGDHARLDIVKAQQLKMQQWLILFYKIILGR